MKRGPKRASPRTQRRSAARAHERLVVERRRLAALEPGGSSERPIAVASAAVIEVQALSQPCLACDESRQRLVEHRAEEIEGARLRVVDVRCAVCSASRRFFFEIVNAGAN